MQELSIIDLRVFNYFSHRQDMESTFLITDIVRAIRDNEVLITSQEDIIRDFINPLDFYQLILKIAVQKHLNVALDCYSKEPITKYDLLESMAQEFGLTYQFDCTYNLKNDATGLKRYYYSVNKSAEDYGYVPEYSSISGLYKEFNLLFS